MSASETKTSPSPWVDHYGEIMSGDRVVARHDWRVSDDDPQWLADASLIVAESPTPAVLVDAQQRRAA